MHFYLLPCLPTCHPNGARTAKTSDTRIFHQRLNKQQSCGHLGEENYVPKTQTTTPQPSQRGDKSHLVHREGILTQLVAANVVSIGGILVLVLVRLEIREILILSST